MSKHDPIRIFEGNTKPYEPFWVWRNADEMEIEGPDSEIGSGEPELELYGYISEYSWFDDDVTPKMFKNDLYKIGNKGPITIRINSGGGDLIAASVIRATLMDYPGRVRVKIDGLAASAATIVAIAGNEVQMNESAYFMIHDPSVSFFLAVLNIEELDQLLSSLKTAKNGIIDSYITKTGASRERLSRMMADETWLTAKEAMDLGFVDEVLAVNNRKGLGQNAAIVNALHSFEKVPAQLLQTDAPKIDQQVADQLRAKAKLYRRSLA